MGGEHSVVTMRVQRRCGRHGSVYAAHTSTHTHTHAMYTHAMPKPLPSFVLVGHAGGRSCV